HAQHVPNRGLESNLDEKVNRNRMHVAPQHDSYDLSVDPYRNGPSAIDKAVHIFFFTEIIRGIPLVESKVFLPLNALRNVDCIGEFLPSAIYYHVSIREGSFIASLPWRTCTTPLSQR